MVSERISNTGDVPRIKNSRGGGKGDGRGEEEEERTNQRQWQQQQVLRKFRRIEQRTFGTCPLCKDGFGHTFSSVEGFTRHVIPNTVPRELQPCPICAAMPWGRPDYVCQNIVAHVVTTQIRVSCDQRRRGRRFSARVGYERGDCLKRESDSDFERRRRQRRGRQ